jgi:hypothetical protein
VLDFRPVRDRLQTLSEMAEGLMKADLVTATDSLFDDLLARIDGVIDADVTFMPVDPLANDQFASSTSDVRVAWTLPHVIVHLAASAEESGFIAAELARGVARDGRSRWETPWQSVTTAEHTRACIHESRRMIRAMLEVWPQHPHLDVTVPASTGPRNAVARFLSGLNHADSHLAQVSEIVRQARAAR